MSHKLINFQTSKMCRDAPTYHCVAVKKEGDMMYVADTKNPDQAPLAFDGDEWSSFIKGVKNGDFDYAN